MDIIRKLRAIYFNLALSMNNNSSTTLLWFYTIIRGVKIDIYEREGRFIVKDFKFKGEVALPRKKRILQYLNGMDYRLSGIRKKYFLESVQFSKGDIVVDCGANIGELYLCLPSYIAYKGFEPAKEERECLKININGGGEVYEWGLSNNERVVTFYSCPDDADSSIIEPPAYEKSINIKVKRLDSLILNTNIKFFKLEAEGAEIEVLEGASEILHNIEFIAADLGYERGVSMESTFLSVTNYLLKRNFTLLEFDFIRMSFLYKNNAHGG
jgi:FkbM family methyltransferase